MSALHQKSEPDPRVFIPPAQNRNWVRQPTARIPNAHRIGYP